MKLIIAGSRSIVEYSVLIKALKYFEIHADDVTEVVCGDCNLGEVWANNHNVKVKHFPAKWDDLEAVPCKVKTNSYGEYNVLAGHNRNQLMAEYCDRALILWDGKSKGALSMIEKMETLGKKVDVYEL